MSKPWEQDNFIYAFGAIANVTLVEWIGIIIAISLGVVIVCGGVYGLGVITGVIKEGDDEVEQSRKGEKTEKAE